MTDLNQYQFSYTTKADHIKLVGSNKTICGKDAAWFVTPIKEFSYLDIVNSHRNNICKTCLKKIKNDKGI